MIRSFYNIVPDLPEPPSPMMANGREVSEEELSKLFPSEVAKQEFNHERFVHMPLELARLYEELLKRPRPLHRAYGLERKLGLRNTRIYYKREDMSATGSHKLNTALAQLYYANQDGIKLVATETGAGQWGTAVAFASQLFGIGAEIFMVRASYEQKPLRVKFMKLFGANVNPSPSNRTEAGRRLASSHSGSLGIAISEAVEFAMEHGGKYMLGSVLNAVLMHQTVIGLEAMEQMKEIGDRPTHIVGCVGGGSNFAGLAYPFYGLSSTRPELIAAEPAEVPTMTKGRYEYDYADTAGIVPQLKMHTLGHEFQPPPIAAGGLRYHGLAPTLSVLVRHADVRSVAIPEKEALAAGLLFARSEGVVPALETAHAVAAAIRIAKSDSGDAIVIGFSGHGLLQLRAYEKAAMCMAKKH